MNLETALETIGVGKFHYQMLLAGGLMLYAANSDSYAIGYALAAAECELALAGGEKTLLMTAGVAGATCAQLFWGYAADRCGRRRVLARAILFGFLCSALSALAPSVWFLATCRFLNGVFVAAASSLTFAYVSEFFPAARRSTAVLLVSVFVGVALAALPLWAWLIIARRLQLHVLGTQMKPWRVYLLAAGSSGLAAACAAFFCPESPRFLVRAGRTQDALKVLNVMYARNVARGAGLQVSGDLRDDDAPTTSDAKVLELVAPQYVRKTLLACGLQFGLFATSCGLFLWYPDIVRRTSQATRDVTVCQALDSNAALNRTDVDAATGDCVASLDDSVYLQNVFVGVAYTIGYGVITALIRKLGIRNILVGFLGASGLATFALLFVAQRAAINALFVLLLTLSGVCIVVVNAAVVDMFPTHVRGMAVSAAMLGGSFGSIVASASVGYLLAWNCAVTFVLFGLSLICCALMSVLLSFCKSCDD